MSGLAVFRDGAGGAASACCVLKHIASATIVMPSRKNIFHPSSIGFHFGSPKAPNYTIYESDIACSASTEGFQWQIFAAAAEYNDKYVLKATRLCEAICELTTRITTARILFSFIAVALFTLPAEAEGKPLTAKVLSEGVDFGDWVKTQKLCEQILKQSPDDAEALTTRALINGSRGRTEDALKDCDRVLRVKPKFKRAILLKGALLCGLGKNQDGQKLLKDYLEETKLSTDLQTRNSRALANKSLKNFDLATKISISIEQETKTAKKHRDLFERGLAQIELCKFKDAVNSFAKIRKAHKVSPRLITFIAYCHAMSGDYSSAQKEFEEVAKLEPEYIGNEGAWGFALEKQKKYDQAIEHYKRAIQSQKEYGYGYRGIGRCNASKGNHKEALKYFDRALVLTPDDANTYIDRAYTHSALSQFEQAAKDAKQATVIEPKNPYAWTKLSCSLAELGKWQAALTASKHALKYKSDLEAARFHRDWCEREIKLTAERTEAIRRAPNDAEAYFKRGLMYRDQKLYNESIADLTTSIKITPWNEKYYCARGCARVLNHNYNEAIEDCSRSIQLNSKREHPFISRGKAYSAIGKFDLALQDFNEAIELHPKCIEALTERAQVYRCLKKADLALSDQKTVKLLTANEKTTTQTRDH